MNQTDLNDNNDANQSQFKSYSSSQAVWEANEGSSVNKWVKSPFFHFEWRSSILILLSKQSNSFRAVNNDDAASSQTTSEKNHFTVKNKGPETGMASVRTQFPKKTFIQPAWNQTEPPWCRQTATVWCKVFLLFQTQSFGGGTHQVGSGQIDCSPTPKTEVKVYFSLSQLKCHIPSCQTFSYFVIKFQYICPFTHI